MNKVELVGRITRDPEVRYTQSDTPVCTARFSVAVNRRFKNAEGNYEADFINCVAFGKSGEFIEKYFKKGMAIGISGRIQTGSYTNKDGVKIYTTDVVVEESEFVEGKSKGEQATSPAPSNVKTASVPESLDEELPFN